MAVASVGRDKIILLRRPDRTVAPGSRAIYKSLLNEYAASEELFYSSSDILHINTDGASWTDADELLLPWKRKYRAFLESAQGALVWISYGGFHGIAALQAAIQLGVPCIYECSRLVTPDAAARFPWPGEQWRKFRESESRALMRASHVLAPTLAMKRKLSDWGRQDAIQLPLLPEVMETHPFSRDRKLEKEFVPGGRYIIGFRDALDYGSGLATLMEAASLANEEGYPVSLLVMGAGPLRNYYQELARQYGVQTCFPEASPSLPEERFLSLADAFAFPWLNTPGRNLDLPCFLADAMASGKPVLASNLAGIRELVSDNVTGLLIEPGDSARWAARITELASQPAKGFEMAEAAKAAVHRKRSAEQAASITRALMPGGHVRQDEELSGRLLALSLTDPRYAWKNIHPGWPWLKVAAIMDEFTFSCFQPECLLLQLLPDQWEAQMDSFRPDMLFLESAWQGKDSKWAGHLINYSQPLASLIEYCRKRTIPVIFWNKEDPPSYSIFLDVAKKADFIFTTDADCIPKYKKDTGNPYTYLLPFSMQPKHNNPIEKYARKNKFCFAGSWYNKYPLRQAQFEMLFDVAAQFSGMDIYDRNHGLGLKDYIYPAKFQSSILGKLPFSEIDRSYKGYRFGVNINTVQHSQTMFARRVYELAACNTLVVSNFSRGMFNFFGDLVIGGDNAEDLAAALRPVVEDTVKYKKARLRALRHVMASHSCKNRLEYIQGKIWSDRRPQGKKILVVAQAINSTEATQIIEAFTRQKWPDKMLFITGKNLTSHAANNIRAFTGLEQCQKASRELDWDYITTFSAENWYGPWYLTDLALGNAYFDGGFIGKGAEYAIKRDSMVLNSGQEYAFMRESRLDTAIWHRDMDEDFWEALHSGKKTLCGEGLGLDAFSFIRGGAAAGAKAGVDPEDLPNQGIDMGDKILPLTEAMGAKTEIAILSDSANTGISLKSLCKTIENNRIIFTMKDDDLHIRSFLPKDKYQYVYGARFKREQINLLNQNQINYFYDGDLDTQVAFFYLNKDGNNIDSKLIRFPGPAFLSIPESAVYIQIALRIRGSGEAVVHPVIAGKMAEQPSFIFFHAHDLLACNHTDVKDVIRAWLSEHGDESYSAPEVFGLGDIPVEYGKEAGLDWVVGPLACLLNSFPKNRIQRLSCYGLDERTLGALRALAGNRTRIEISNWAPPAAA